MNFTQHLSILFVSITLIGNLAETRTPGYATQETRSSVGAISANSTSGEWQTTKTHIRFFSTTPVEDIEANNYDASSTLNTSTGEFTFSVPMQSFQFAKSLMQRHFNQARFLDTRTHPRARLTGRITNLDDIRFDTDGAYTANIEGEMTIRGVTNPFTTTAKIAITNGITEVESIFPITLADYGVAFDGGRPSTNIAKTVEVTVRAEYQANP
jgi:polyisoprenoid-binding protein YceI